MDQAPPALISRYRPNTTQFVSGSLVLTHRTGFYSAAITFGQNIRFRGERRKFAHWSHAAIIVSSNGDIVEALGKGVERNHISKYAFVDTAIITPYEVMSDYAVQRRVVTFAEHAVGREYDIVEIGSLGLYLVAGGKLRFGIDNQMICSGLASDALCRTDAIFQHEPVWMMPGDMGEYYNVT